MDHTVISPNALSVHQLEELPRFDTVTRALRDTNSDDAIFVLYPERIRRAANRFVHGLPAQILYAVKANPHPFVLQTLWASGVRNFDVASIREAELVASLLPDATMYLMHPVKSRATIARAYALGIRDFSLDCHDELSKMESVLGSVGDLHLHVRIALDETAIGNNAAAMPLTRKFGANRETTLSLLSRLANSGAKTGLTFHVGSQCMEPSAYAHAIGYAHELSIRAGVTLDSLDIGGGFPVSYPGMIAAPWEDYFTHIEAALEEYGLGQTAILAEPGRALVAEAGSTLTRIELRKGRDLYLNEGTYGSLFDAGSCQWRFPVSLYKINEKSVIAHTPEGTDNTAFRFFGPTCDSLDRMDGPFMLPDAAGEGDWIEIGNLGAYGQTLATRFNGFYGEQTVIVDDCGVVPSSPVVTPCSSTKEHALAQQESNPSVYASLEQEYS